MSFWQECWAVGVQRPAFPISGVVHGPRPRLTRLDATRFRIDNPHGIDAVLFAGEQVPVETAAVSELLDVLQLQQTVEQFADASPASFEQPPHITQVAITPDFHKARGIPVGTVLATQGFVVPQAIGNDINCGMRLHLTTLDADQVAGKVEELKPPSGTSTSRTRGTNIA